MKRVDFQQARWFFNVLSLSEEPLGIYYTNTKPTDCITPKKTHLPTYDEEQRGEANFDDISNGNSCVFQSILRARRNGTAACFDREHFGCPGGAFAFGFNKPQLDLIAHYISTGFPGYWEGEHYLESPEMARAFFEHVDPPIAPEQFLVFKPLSQFISEEVPELVVFFERPEIISGLHQLATFVTNDLEAVRSPMGAGCFNVVSWPLKYLRQGELKAVLGSWDPSCRKYFRIDEISFTVPYAMFITMVRRWDKSFLGNKNDSTWEMVKKRVRLGREKWGDKTADWNTNQG